MLVGEAAPSGPGGGKVLANRAGQFLASAEAFLSKSIFNCPHTRQLIAELHTNEPLRRLCGYPVEVAFPMSPASRVPSPNSLNPNSARMLKKPSFEPVKRAASSATSPAIPPPLKPANASRRPPETILPW